MPLRPRGLSAVLFGLAATMIAEAAPPDPYQGYRDWPLSNVTVCGVHRTVAVAASMEALHCVVLTEEGVFGPTPSNGSNACVAALATCSPDALEALDAIVQDQGGTRTVVVNDAAEYLRKLDGVTESWDDFSGIHADMSQGFYREYRDFASITSRLKRIAKAHKGCSDDVAIELEKRLPNTYEGRNIFAIRIRGKNWVQGDPRVIVTGVQHAREWIAAMTSVYMAETAAKLYCAEPSLITTTELVIVPVVNPDGFEYSAKNDRYWRKNREPNHGSVCRGVDINRNWDVDFGNGYGAGGSHSKVCSSVYSAQFAMSQPETQAVAAILKEAPVSVLLDVHSFGQMVLGPWGYTNRPFRNSRFEKSDADQLGTLIRDAIVHKHGADYLYGSGDAGGATYVASGMLQDYASSLGALGYTIELRPRMNGGGGLGGFAPSKSQILPCAEEAMEGLKAAVKWVHARNANVTTGGRRMKEVESADVIANVV